MNTKTIIVTENTGNEFAKIASSLFALETMLKCAIENNEAVPCVPDIIGITASWLDEMTNAVFFKQDK